MKKLLLPFLGILLTLNVFAQTNKTNLVVFSEDGDKFYLVINGIRQNMKAETNVKVTDLTTENFSFTIIFEDTKIPSIKKTQAMPFGNEYTFRIKDKKGKKSMKYFGETALSAPSNNTSSTTVAYHTTEIPVTTNVGTTQTGNATGVSTNTNTIGTGVSSNVNVTGGTNETTTTTTSTSTTTTGGNTTGTTGIGMNVDIKDNTNSEGGNVSTGVNMGGVGMNIDINVSENGAGINMNGTGFENGTSTTTTGTSTSGGKTSGSTTTTYSSTTTTTTTSSSTGGTGISSNAYVGATGESASTNVNGTGINTGTNTSGNTTSGSTSTYTGTSNYMCGAAMGSTDFATAKKSIESKDFEDSKFTVAKQVTKGNCLSAAQIKEIMEVFDFEATKLDYAKYAYDFCYDKNNYYKLNDAFDFESSVDDLNTYIEKK